MHDMAKYERCNDEDIPHVDTTTAPTAAHIQGPMTRARAKQLNYQVLSFLGTRLPNYCVPGYVLWPMKTARNDEIQEFCRLPNYRVMGGHGPLNSSPEPKTLCYSP